MNEKRKIMKHYKNILRSFRTAGFGLAVAAAAVLAACDDEQFVRDAGSMPAEAGTTPSGALYAVGSFDTRMQDFCISEDTDVKLVYRLDYPAQTDVKVTLALGNQSDIDKLNDELGLSKLNNGTAVFKCYRMLPDDAYEQFVPLALTVQKGKTESEPVGIKIIYEKLLNSEAPNFSRLVWPWALPLKVKTIEGEVNALPNQILYVKIRPANKILGDDNEDDWGNYITEIYPKEVPLTCITYCDCRKYDPAYAIYYYHAFLDYETFLLRLSPEFDIEILHPAFILTDAQTGMPKLQPNDDLIYVLTHQERYVAPQRKFNEMKICVSVETDRKSPVGLCNLSDEARASLVWQIKDFVTTYGLDGVALNDAPAAYAAAGAAPVDKASYTKFLKELRTALGDDKLIMVSYDAGDDSALYEAHDGLKAGDYIDWAWPSKTNEIWTPYAATPSVKPIIGLPVEKFSPVVGDAIENDKNYEELFQSGMDTSTGQWYPEKGLPILQELYGQGQCSVLVYGTLRANEQNFYETNFSQIPLTFATVPEGTNLDGLGMFTGAFNQSTMKTYPMGGGYGSGLKDW